jgi:RHS repeat-associated protein
VRYFNGEVQHKETDISSNGFGLGWGHTRTYSNAMSDRFSRGNGWNWNVDQWPMMLVSPFPNATYAVFSNIYDIDWFKQNVDGSFTTLFGRLKTLEHDAANHRFRLIEQDGTVTIFNDFTHATRPGLFISVTTPGGNTTAIVGGEEGEILEVQRSYTSGGDTVTESYLYDFNPSTLPPQIEFVTLRRRVNSGSWESVVNAEYSYYGDNEDFGSKDDLKLVTRKKWNGSSWELLDKSYYRYWKAGESASGFEHGLKFVVGPEAFVKLSAAGDPFTASNATVAQYADNYFEYDSDHRVTKEMTEAGSRTFTFAYTTNPNYDPQQEPDYNFWMRKTVETLPDGTQNIIFCNANGQTMLDIVKSGSSEWVNFTRYDDAGRTTLKADPAAVSGYDEDLNDLMGYDPNDSSFEYLKDSEGLIQITEYYTSTGSGAAAGYVKNYRIKNGQLGSEVKLRQFEYTSHSANGVTVYPVSKEIVYPDASNQSITIETSYSYGFYSGKTQPQWRTTTLPVISTGQNGSGSANSFIDWFDEYNNRIWHKDERGFITRFSYNIQTGAIVQRIDDVDTSQVGDEPAGWTTPTGGGLHLVTDFEHDDLGRTTQELGPSHSIDLGGTATTIRQATWTVYDDPNNTVRVGQGYATGSSPSYTYTLINPVAITIRDKDNNVTDEIAATRASTSGRLTINDTFAQSAYVRWTTHQYTDCCKLASTRVYHDIPSSGTGSSGTNYNQTDFGYDVRDRRNRVVTPGGTITRTVFDARSLPTSVWVGTDDTGASASNPAGSGAPNNMVQLVGNVYDGGSAGGDGNLTEQTVKVDSNSADDRITTFTYDFRNRRVTTAGEIDFFEKLYYDNRDLVTRQERYNTNSSGNLIARSETKYDDLGRVYQTIRYGVDPSTGSVGNALTDNTWYDPAGNVLKTLPSGAKVFAKFVYDGLNRQTKQYAGYDLSESSYADAGSVTGDTILEQTETAYDAANNAIQTTTRQRYHNATGTGELNGPTGPEPKSRVTYAAAWHDGIGRVVATAAYGTNGGSALSRPSTVPSRSDTCLVSTTEFNSRGEAYKVVDPKATVTRQEFDDAGRRTKLIENYRESRGSSSSSSSSSSSNNECPGSDDANRTTVWTYTADNKIATLTALNAETGDQTTTYTYGTTLSDSAVASSLLLRKETYPDSSSGSDVVLYAYNRQAQATLVTDQNGTVHTLEFDELGRLKQDRVTTLGTNIDGTVRRISTTYEVRGLVEKITSHDNATVGSGNIVNEVQRTYNHFGQLTHEYQAHGGAVNTSTSPKCQYAYADGSANHVRPTSMTYPDGRVLNDNYGTSNSMADAMSRIAALVDDDGTTHLANCSYLGLGSIVEVDETEPDLRYTLVGTAGGDDPDTGDIYRGLDRFGRVKDLLWRDYGASSDVVRIKHGYDRASNRLYREDPVAAANSKKFDELYVYDGLYRLHDLDRGTLANSNSEISNLQFAQCWTLDSTGNWAGFRQDDTGAGTWDLEQARTANAVNEITDITETAGPSWATPGYDAAGNMTSVPKPSDMTSSYTGTYDAWNQLVKLTESSTNVQINEYDGLRRRTVRKSYTSGTLSETRHYYYSAAWQILEERLGTSPDSADPDRQFVWGLRYIDDLILRDRDMNADGSLDERLYALQDPNWNVVAITDENGDVQERYAYDAYGVTKVLTATFGNRTSSNFDWETTYAGYRWDGGTELLQVRNRIYHSAVGTWIQRDPAGYLIGRRFFLRGGGLFVDANLLAYVSSSPTNVTDSNGLTPPYGPVSGWLNDVARRNAKNPLINIPAGMAVGPVALIDTLPGAIHCAASDARKQALSQAARSKNPIDKGAGYLAYGYGWIGEGFAQGANFHAGGTTTLAKLPGGIFSSAKGLFSSAGSAAQAAPTATKVVYTVTGNIDEIASSGRVWGQTEGSVYGMASEGAPAWQTLRGARASDDGVLVFEGQAAELFKPHEIWGPFSGLKRGLGQLKAGFGDIAFDPSKAIREGNRLIIREGTLAPHMGQSCGKAAARLWGRRALDLGIDAGAAGTAAQYYQNANQ